MLFSSYEFVFAFFPIVLVGYFLLSKIPSPKWQRLFLVGASLYFYAWFNIYYLWIILASIGLNYIIAQRMQVLTVQGPRKVLYILGLLLNIGLLGYFKYYDFFIENINGIFAASFTLKYLLLPLGISFFTFQQFSFLISIYKRTEKLEGLLEYSLFVVFFPQLIAGPIVLYSEMMPQFQEEQRRYANIDHLTRGLFTFAIGLFKKIVIADTVAAWATNGFDTLHTLDFYQAWATSLAYTLQIYFDFSGYCDMAIGIAKMFNIDLPMNFNSPYKSKSIKEFWGRWHITLGRALSTYLYLPLGGNRKGKVRTYINLMVTFLVSGLWHGAAWTFVFWGALHGLASVTERACASIIAKINQQILHIGTFLFVNVAWVFFRAKDWSSALKVLKGMFMPESFNFFGLAELTKGTVLSFPVVITTFAIVFTLALLIYITFKQKNAIEMTERFNTTYTYAIITVILLVVSIIHLNRISPFIYYNF